MKTEQEKAEANAGIVTVSPPTNNDVKATGSDEVGMIAHVNKEEDTMTITNNAQEAYKDWTDAEDDEALARHGISPNHLFGKDLEESTGAKGTAPTAQGTGGPINDKSTAIDLMAAENSPEKRDQRVRKYQAE